MKKIRTCFSSSYAVLKKETKEFTREVAVKKSDDKNVKAAMEKALLYIDNHELPAAWDHAALLGTDTDELSGGEVSFHITALCKLL